VGDEIMAGKMLSQCRCPRGSSKKQALLQIQHGISPYSTGIAKGDPGLLLV
jgi:hypothetical protein